MYFGAVRAVRCFVDPSQVPADDCDEMGSKIYYTWICNCRCLYVIPKVFSKPHVSLSYDVAILKCSFIQLFYT